MSSSLIWTCWPKIFPEYKDFRKAYINSHIVELDDKSKKETLEEGCLSLPGIHENVTRPTRIRVQYLDEDMKEHDEWVEGYLARVMQHEFDHLEGTMFIDRLSPSSQAISTRQTEVSFAGRYRCSYRTKPIRK